MGYTQSKVFQLIVLTLGIHWAGHFAGSEIEAAYSRKSQINQEERALRGSWPRPFYQLGFTPRDYHQKMLPPSH